VPYPHHLSRLIDNPLRALLISPRTLVDRANLEPHHQVLELGPGSGYFSVELARRIPKGRLDLVDVQDAMLSKAKAKLRTAGITNARFTVADGGKPLPFHPSRFDAAILVTVLGEIPDEGAAIDALARVIKPGGSLVIHEQIPDPDIISLRRLKSIVEPRGFSFVRRHGPWWNYTAVFRRD
jgi:ubiquinone/menaquinone biosynthesis C-methylase UbiE